MSKFYLKNKELFYQRFNKNYLIPSPDETVETKNGKETLKINDVWVASRYDPLKEAERFASLQKINSDDYIILYGIGLGYHLLPILERLGPKGFLYCVETNPQLIANAFAINDLRDLLKDPRFFLITSSTPEKLAQAFDKYILWNIDTVPSDSIKVIIHEASFYLIPTVFQFIKTTLERLKFEREGDSRFEVQMKENLKANYEILINSYPLKFLGKLINNSPVIVAGAGPSLDSSISFIKKIKDKAVIIAVDTALTPLLDNGIRPDFSISIDPQKKSLQNYNLQDSFDIPLIMFPTTQKDIAGKNNSYKVISVLKDSWAANFFKNKLDFLGLSLGGSSISVIAADIALNHAKGPVFFAGFDFSFPALKSYASKTPELNKWKNHLGPCFTLETAEFKLINSKQTITVESYTGKLIPTFQSLYSYLRSLEAVLEFYSRKDVYILRPEGAFIRGVEAIYKIEELIGLTALHKKNLSSPEEYDFPEETKQYVKEVLDNM